MISYIHVYMYIKQKEKYSWTSQHEVVRHVKLERGETDQSRHSLGLAYSSTTVNERERVSVVKEKAVAKEYGK